jgi:hypothetical protein
MTNPLDERIDHHQSMDWTNGHRVMRALFHGAQYQGIANTIVQLICRSTSSVIPPSRPIGLDERHCKKQACPNRSPVRRKTMSIIDKALEANRNYAKNYHAALGKRPAPKIVVVTCMDPRLSDLPGILGLPQTDIDVIRTGGPAVTEDVLGELIVSNRVLGTT